MNNDNENDKDYSIFDTAAESNEGQVRGWKTSFKFNQLHHRRVEAYHQHETVTKQFKLIRSIIDDIDNDHLKHGFPNEVADVQEQMSRIGFIQSELHHTLSGNAAVKAKKELEIRMEILFSKLSSFAELGVAAWQDRLRATQEYFDYQSKIGKLEDTISSLDHAYFTHIEYDKTHPSAPPPEVPDEIVEQWYKESQLTESEIHDYERQQWEDEKQWYEIDVERAEREKASAEEEVDEYKERLRNALQLEKEIEKDRAVLQKEVSKLLRLQQTVQKDTLRRVHLEENYKEAQHNLNSNIQIIEGYFEDIIPTSIWPDYIMGKPSEAYDTEAAQAFQDSLQETFTFEEQREFFSHQDHLIRLRKEQKEAEHRLVSDRKRLEVAARASEQEMKAQRAKVADLRAALNVKNGMRAAELKVALPRIRVEGEDRIDADENMWADVKVQGVSAKGEVGNVVEASATLSFGLDAKASAEVIQKAEENDNSISEMDAQVARGDALQKMYDQLLVKTSVTEWRSGLRQDPNNGKYKEYNDAVDMLNRQHEEKKLVGKIMSFGIKKNKHAYLMMAFRCGIELTPKDNVIHAEIISRGEPTNNTIVCYFPKWQKTGHVAVYPKKTGDWQIYTGKHYDDDWVQLAMTTPGVPPMAKIDMSETIENYLKYYELIQARIDADVAAALQEMEKKKASA